MRKWFSHFDQKKTLILILSHLLLKNTDFPHDFHPCNVSPVPYIRSCINWVKIIFNIRILEELRRAPFFWYLKHWKYILTCNSHLLYFKLVMIYTYVNTCQRKTAILNSSGNEHFLTVQKTNKNVLFQGSYSIFFETEVCIHFYYTLYYPMQSAIFT